MAGFLHYIYRNSSISAEIDLLIVASLAAISRSRLASFLPAEVTTPAAIFGLLFGPETTFIKDASGSNSGLLSEAVD